MTTITEDRDRNVIPRWRSYKTATLLSETADTHPSQSAPRRKDPELARRMEEFSANRHAVFAADAASVAISLNQPEYARDALAYLVGPDGESLPLARQAAAHALTDQTPDRETFGYEDHYARIKHLRCRLVETPRDAFLWIDLALVYTIVGLKHQSRVAAQRALFLAGDERFILRSVSRLLIHQNDLIAAHDLLSSAARTAHDPWLMSAEIAAARSAGRHSRLLKIASATLDDRALPPRHTSELAAALATIEHDDGRLRFARRLFQRSLRDPTENAVAQVAWARRRDSQLGVSLHGLDAPRSFEARSWTAMLNGRWDQALEQTRLWQCDQPFSSRPAMNGSYIASMLLDDPAEGERITRIGLVANPADPMLRNNLAVCLALRGRVADAEAELHRIDKSMLDAAAVAVTTATEGLVEFRKGNPAVGRALYRQAIEHAADTHLDRRISITAAIRLAFEEIHAGTPQGEAVLGELRDLKRTIRPSEKDLAELIDKLERLRAALHAT
jgi:Flp pilus assembly protein TadD